MAHRSDSDLLKATALQNAAAVLKARQYESRALLESHRTLELKTQEPAVSLANAHRAEESLRDETRVLELLNRIGRSLSSKLDLPAVLQAVTDAGTEIGGAEFGAFVSRAPALDHGSASGTASFSG